MPSKIIRDDLHYLLFSSVYHRLESPKAQRKAFVIAECAIKCIAKKGLDHVSLEMIAREAAVTRPLLKHYFDDLEDIKLTATKYIRFLFQKLTLESIETGKNYSSKLENYVGACIDWTESHRTHVSVWFSLIHRAGAHRASRALNTASVNAGTERMTALLREGAAAGEFQVEDVESQARMIQVLITGAVFSAVSEDIPDLRKFRAEVQRQCLQIAKGTKTQTS